MMPRNFGGNFLNSIDNSVDNSADNYIDTISINDNKWCYWRKNGQQKTI
jgi:hypothetical protein